jgi:hypothetical protein
MSRAEGGLSLFDIRACNKSFLAKQLWNIHLKTYSIWIQWVHHFYLRSSSVWNIHAHHSSSPLWKSIISLRDRLVEDCGGQAESISLMGRWYNEVGPFLIKAYDFFCPTDTPVTWERVVWEHWSMPKYNFILWLAIMGKLWTRDRLRFIPTNTFCVFCRHEEQSHNHIFFACDWTFC